MTALIVIDMQVGLFTAPRPDQDAVVTRINDLAENRIDLSDAGSYIRAAYNLDHDGGSKKKTRQLSLTAFPTSSDRMRLGYSYRLQFADSSVSQFITEKGYLQKGDCVSVERGEYANIRRVANVLCENGPSTSVDQTHLQDAQQCHAAKQQL